MQNQSDLAGSFSDYSEIERTALLNKVIAYENERSKKSNIHLIRADQLSDFIARNQRKERTQVIVEKEGHYFALDLLQQADRKSCILLNASQSEQSRHCVTELEGLGFTVVQAQGLDQGDFANQPMQTDQENSALFALDHCILLAQTSNDLHTNLQEKAIKGQFSWDCLPAAFLRNTQSVAFIEHYMQVHADILDTETKQYIQIGLSDTQNEAITKHVLLKIQRLHQKEQIITAMNQAIQEHGHSWSSTNKPGKKIELMRIRNEFENQDLYSDLSTSQPVIAFDAALDQTRWRQPNPQACIEFRQNMQALRSEAEPTVHNELRV